MAERFVTPVVRGTARAPKWALVVLVASICAPGVLAEETAAPDYSDAERSQVPEVFRWRVEDIYSSEDAWHADLAEARRDVDSLRVMVRGWTSSPGRMAAFLHLYEKIVRLDAKLSLWPSLQHQTHLTDAGFRDRESEAGQLSVDLKTAVASMDADITGLGREGIDEALRVEPRLVPYRALLDEALRKKGHLLSNEAEEVAAAADLFSDGPGTAAYYLMNVDMPTPEVALPDGSRVPLDAANRDRLLQSKDPRERLAACEAAAANRKSFENTFAALADMSVKRDLFRARIRGFPDCLSAELFQYDVDPAIYANLVGTVRSNLGPYHRYLRVRSRMLGLEELHPYDRYLPAAADVPPRFTFDQARTLVEESTAPLGPSYAAWVKRAFDDRWMDVYPHKDKAGLGSATSGLGVHPYVLLNYGGDFFDLITVAHELGHALSFAIAEDAQPFATAQPSWFLSEVPSTLNEILLMNRLVAGAEDDRAKAAMLAEEIDRLSLLLFFSAEGAEFERAVHQQVEGGGTLSAEWLDAKQLELTRHYCGHAEGAMVVDDYVESDWIHPNLFFAPFQSYFYVVGAVTSLALAEEILGGGVGGGSGGGVGGGSGGDAGGGARGRKYVAFLEAGSSRPPSALLAEAGIDLGSPETVLRALRAYDRLVDQLEAVEARLERPAK
jgi:oligoendopeptidase F